MDSQESITTALATVSENIHIGSITSSWRKDWKFLTTCDGKLVSLVGLQLGAIYEFLPLYREHDKLCPIGDLAKVMLGGNYPTHREKIRAWWPGAVRRARKQGVFLVGDARQGRNGRLMNVAICPTNPPQYLRVLAEAQIMQQLRRGDISNAIAAELLRFLNGTPIDAKASPEVK